MTSYVLKGDFSRKQVYHISCAFQHGRVFLHVSHSGLSLRLDLLTLYSSLNFSLSFCINLWVNHYVQPLSIDDQNHDFFLLLFSQCIISLIELIKKSIVLDQFEGDLRLVEVRVEFISIGDFGFLLVIVFFFLFDSFLTPEQFVLYNFVVEKLRETFHFCRSGYMIQKYDNRSLIFV